MTGSEKRFPLWFAAVLGLVAFSLLFVIEVDSFRKAASDEVLRRGLLMAVLFGVCMVVLVYLFTRHMTRRIDSRMRQLEIAAANETFRREFTSDVTHELKSPVTAILGSVEMLDDGTEMSEIERKELFGIIKTEAARLNALVGDVLALARTEIEESRGGADLVRMNLADLVTDVLLRETPKAKARHVALEAEGVADAWIRGDAERLEDVLVNLIENALRYSGSDRIAVKMSRGEGNVTVSVCDYGIGIPSEHLDHVFERFYRVDKARSRSLGGTGLGLAIVKHTVRLHGGDVSVESDPGRKTVFSFTVPQDHG